MTKSSKEQELEIIFQGTNLNSLAITLYLYLLFGNYVGISGILLSALLGLTMVCIAFNVMHDACHGSYSSKNG